ncbi:hypothetical protein [Mycolicibacterium aubagnense]|uniref:Uncharacterized protein n=1 Tax=Mycolicibacterium aubagnense TaxID=319707 RepID=A0ABM7IER1_9MYCO|nr:hypothetical protein [Mycolicibacterium aubagnense]WGI33097.1 hypothetical protein QDT91_01490 [Mycolicibacterium aubagnense]BBX85207.1 hypothetical protein MAUB_30800 [Mycolicibacterium aubagnense]
MNPALDARIHTMFMRDVIIASTLAAAMWATLIFVFTAAFSVIDSTAVKAILAIAFAVLGVFNSMGLLSMSRRYKIEREHVYGEDIHHIDANRQARKAIRNSRQATRSLATSPA